MTRLEPITETQSIYIYPRDYSVFENGVINGLSMRVVESGSNIEETITDITSTKLENTIQLDAQYSILKEGNSYYIVITINDTLWYRGYALCTSQSDKNESYTLNTDKYKEVNQDTKYTILND